MFLDLNDKYRIENKFNDIVIIKSIGANLSDECREDIVYLMGKKDEDSTVYYESLYIVISKGKSGENITLKLKNGGYNPKIEICDFNGDKLDEILVTSELGGSGGYLNANVYRIKDEKLQEIFNSEKISNENIYTVNYKNNYIVEVKDEIENKKYLIDISLKDKSYLNEVYDENGIVNKGNEGEVLAVGGCYTADVDNDNISEIFIVRRIIGLYNSDTLGYINSVFKYNGNYFNVIKKSLSIEGVAEGCSRSCNDIKNIVVKNKCNIDFTKISFIESEKIKDCKIERALEKELNIKSGIDKVTYLYNKIDLNDNNKNEVVVYIEGPRFCMEKGCTIVILKDEGKSYSVISKINGAKNPIIISDEKTNGYKNIIMQVDTRCGDVVYKELRFNGNSYPLNHMNEPRVKKGNKIEGIALISDDLFYVKGIEF